MRKIEFTIPIKINGELSLNSIYKGLHWAIRRKQSQRIHEIVKLSMESQSIPKRPFEKPVNINFKWHSKLDLDNHGYIAKLIIDSLKGYLIKDDTEKYINKITHEYQKDKGVRVKIEEIETMNNYEWSV